MGKYSRGDGGLSTQSQPVWVCGIGEPLAVAEPAEAMRHIPGLLRANKKLQGRHIAPEAVSHTPYINGRH